MTLVFRLLDLSPGELFKALAPFLLTSALVAGAIELTVGVTDGLPPAASLAAVIVVGRGRLRGRDSTVRTSDRGPDVVIAQALATPRRAPDRARAGLGKPPRARRVLDRLDLRHRDIALSGGVGPGLET